MSNLIRTGNGAFSWWAPPGSKASGDILAEPPKVGEKAKQFGVVIQSDGTYRAPNGATVVPFNTDQGMFFMDKPNGVVYDQNGFLVMKTQDGRIVASPPAWPPTNQMVQVNNAKGPVATAQDVSQVPQKPQLPAWVIPAAGGAAAMAAFGGAAYLIAKSGSKKKR